jgi:hypothetical protein
MYSRLFQTGGTRLPLACTNFVGLKSWGRRIENLLFGPSQAVPGKVRMVCLLSGMLLHKETLLIFERTIGLDSRSNLFS